LEVTPQAWVAPALTEANITCAIEIVEVAGPNGVVAVIVAEPLDTPLTNPRGGQPENCKLSRAVATVGLALVHVTGPQPMYSLETTSKNTDPPTTVAIVDGRTSNTNTVKQPLQVPLP